MSKNRRPRQPAAPSPPANRRPPIWAVGILILSLAGVAAVLVYYFHNGSDGDTVASSPAAAAGAPLSAAQRRALVGRWRRGDANYVLEIRAVAADGGIDAAYLNPRPIHVAKAQASAADGKISVVAELRDRLYPGSYYTLVYDPHDDRLAGIYHHLGIHQDFDVFFTRIGGKP
ncbi:MAG: hypothetical protein ACLQLG_20335 [Thermoguttaceae bacterium]